MTKSIIKRKIQRNLQKKRKAEAVLYYKETKQILVKKFKGQELKDKDQELKAEIATYYRIIL